MFSKCSHWLLCVFFVFFSLRSQGSSLPPTPHSSPQDVDQEENTPSLREVYQRGFIQGEREHHHLRSFLEKKYPSLPQNASQLFHFAHHLPKPNRFHKKLTLILAHSFLTPLKKIKLTRVPSGNIQALIKSKKSTSFPPLWTLNQLPNKRAVVLPTSNKSGKKFALKVHPLNWCVEQSQTEAVLLNYGSSPYEPPPIRISFSSRDSQLVYSATLTVWHQADFRFLSFHMNPFARVRTTKTIFYEGLKQLVDYGKRHLVHQDIKLGNLMLSDRGHIRFVDFGHAVLTTDESFPIGGTLCFQAPEQLLEFAGVKKPKGETLAEDLPKRDVFSFALLIAEILMNDTFFTLDPLRTSTDLETQYVDFHTFYHKVEEKVLEGADLIKTMTSLKVDRYSTEKETKERFVELKSASKGLFPLLWKMLHPLPAKRIGAKDALTQLESLLGPCYPHERYLKALKRKAWERVYLERAGKSSFISIFTVLYDRALLKNPTEARFAPAENLTFEAEAYAL